MAMEMFMTAGVVMVFCAMAVHDTIAVIMIINFVFVHVFITIPKHIDK